MKKKPTVEKRNDMRLLGGFALFLVSSSGLIINYAHNGTGDLSGSRYTYLPADRLEQ